MKTPTMYCKISRRSNGAPNVAFTPQKEWFGVVRIETLKDEANFRGCSRSGKHVHAVCYKSTPRQLQKARIRSHKAFEAVRMWSNLYLWGEKGNHLGLAAEGSVSQPCRRIAHALSKCDHRPKCSRYTLLPHMQDSVPTANLSKNDYFDTRLWKPKWLASQ